MAVEVTETISSVVEINSVGGTSLASTITYIDTNTNLGVSNVQDAIEAVYAAVTELTQEEAIASEAISALQPIYFDSSGQWRVAHANVEAEADAAFAIALTAATTGNTLTGVTMGEMEDSSWSWTPGKRIYLTDAGGLSHIASTSIVKEMALAITPTKILVEPREALVIS